VEAKTYYSASSSWRTYVAEERLITLGDTGRVRVIPARSVQFTRGSFTTGDPEDQFALDQEPSMISADRWKELYLSTDERNKMKERELKAWEERLVLQQNSLLDKVKQQQEANAQPGADVPTIPPAARTSGARSGAPRQA